MCRFAVYHGPPIRISALVTDPEHSIIRQSARSHEGVEPMNGDGYGLAWYVPHLLEEPILFREVTPAWNSPNLASIAKATESGTIFAHVRAATTGSTVSQLNCHPFSHGRLAFMHNGHVAGFGTIRRAMRRKLSDEAYDSIHGTTDTEHLFAWFTDHYRASPETDGLERLGAALARTYADLEALQREYEITEASRLNVAVTDGDRVLVARTNVGQGDRTNSLYVRHGRYDCTGGVAQLGPEASAGNGCVLIASEPLTKEDAWHAVPDQHVVMVDTNRSVEIRPLAAWSFGAEPQAAVG